jgi:hypothetical protein
MLISRGSTVLLSAGCLLLLGPALPSYGANVAPRIVSATMLDRDGDDRADAVRLVYSEAVWHARDADGRYPFAIGNYRIQSVGAAKGTKSLTVLIREKAGKDIAARPSVTYSRTTSRPVKDRRGKQAVEQRFGKTVALDRDGDGYAVRDCRPTDKAAHPGAADAPDLSFSDTNCDGIDGDKKRAIFVSPTGDDGNAGTIGSPVRTLEAGLSRALASPADDDLYVAAGSYSETGTLHLVDGSGVYGGYSASDWTRTTAPATVSGATTAVMASAVTGVDLQLVDITSADATAPGGSSTALTVVAGSDVRLEQTTLRAGAGADGTSGSAGYAGMAGSTGGTGGSGLCDDFWYVAGGTAGAGARPGGVGGRGGEGSSGWVGGSGGGGTPGGAGGTSGDPGRPGQDGSSGAAGERGADGLSRLGVFGPSGYSSVAGSSGVVGTPGNGGGGGGGGGGQSGLFVVSGTGNGGGGGGGGGFPGGAGSGGLGGGASIAAYVRDAELTLAASTLLADAGGDGGTGGFGGSGGAGGYGGYPGTSCTTEVGRGGFGGRGGRGGDGGHGAGGSGGPSIGIAHHNSTVSSDAVTTVSHASGGVGGSSPAGGASNGTPGTATDRYAIP